jgi:excisionase family DNA binding protein
MEVLIKNMNQKAVPERLTLSEAAQYLGIKKPTMYGLTSARKIPFYKFGRSIFFYRRNWMIGREQVTSLQDDGRFGVRTSGQDCSEKKKILRRRG